MLPSCTTTPYLKNEAALHVVQGENLTNYDSKHRGYVLKHNGLDLLIEESPLATQDEWNFLGKPLNDVEDTWRVFDNTAGKWSLQIEAVYTLPAYKIKETIEVKEGGNIVKKEIERNAREIEYVSRRAKRTGEKTEETEDVRVITHNDWEYSIPRVWLDTDNNPNTPEVEHLKPYVKNKDGTIVRLLIPHIGSKVKINERDGRIAVASDEIHFLNKVRLEDYMLRGLSVVPGTKPKDEAIAK